MCFLPPPPPPISIKYLTDTSEGTSKGKGKNNDTNNGDGDGNGNGNGNGKQLTSTKVVLIQKAIRNNSRPEDEEACSKEMKEMLDSLNSKFDNAIDYEEVCLFYFCVCVCAFFYLINLFITI